MTHGETPDDGPHTTLEWLAGGATAAEFSLWLLVLSALTLDVVLTARGLSGGLVEGNPVMRELIEGLGFPVLGLVKAVVLGIAGLVRAARPDLDLLVPLAVGLPWMVVVFINVVMLALG